MSEYTPGLWWHTFVLVWSHVAAVYNADQQIVRHRRLITQMRVKYTAKARRVGRRPKRQEAA